MPPRCKSNSQTSQPLGASDDVFEKTGWRTRSGHKKTAHGLFACKLLNLLVAGAQPALSTENCVPIAHREVCYNDLMLGFAWVSLPASSGIRDGRRTGGSAASHPQNIQLVAIEPGRFRLGAPSLAKNPHHMPRTFASSPCLPTAPCVKLSKLSAAVRSARPTGTRRSWRQRRTSG